MEPLEPDKEVASLQIRGLRGLDVARWSAAAQVLGLTQAQLARHLVHMLEALLSRRHRDAYVGLVRARLAGVHRAPITSLPELAPQHQAELGLDLGLWETPLVLAATARAVVVVRSTDDGGQIAAWEAMRAPTDPAPGVTWIDADDRDEVSKLATALTWGSQRQSIVVMGLIDDESQEADVIAWCHWASRVSGCTFDLLLMDHREQAEDKTAEVIT
jgi:hypothetical protein